MTNAAHEELWLTQESYDRLSEELRWREGDNRQEIAKKIEAAREEGDLKENGGYHAAREEQGKNEARVRQLRQMLDTAQIGTPPDAGDGSVTHGSLVTVELAGEQERFLLASREEAAHATVDVYSPTSPLGTAVLGAKAGDEVSFTTPSGKTMPVKVLAVEACQP